MFYNKTVILLLNIRIVNIAKDRKFATI